MEDNTNIETVDIQQEQPEAKTYSETEVLALIQREADKRVTQALKTQQAKFEQRMSEAEKLRNMDETQRKEYEFEQKLAEFEQQKHDFALLQNKVEASKVLVERGLPVQFVDYVVAADADTMLENINTFEKLFKASVTDAVSARISTGTPKGNTTKQTGLTREDFKKMSIAQQSELYNTNPTLYKELSSR